MKKFLMMIMASLLLFCSPPLHTFYCDNAKDIKEFATVQGVEIVKIDTIGNWKTRSFLIYYKDTAKTEK